MSPGLLLRCLAETSPLRLPFMMVRGLSQRGEQNYFFNTDLSGRRESPPSENGDEQALPLEKKRSATKKGERGTFTSLTNTSLKKAFAPWEEGAIGGGKKKRGAVHAGKLYPGKGAKGEVRGKERKGQPDQGGHSYREKRKKKEPTVYRGEEELLTSPINKCRSVLERKDKRFELHRQAIGRAALAEKRHGSS